MNLNFTKKITSSKIFNFFIKNCFLALSFLCANSFCTHELVSEKWLINPSNWLKRENSSSVLQSILDHPITKSIDAGRKHIEKSPSFFAGLAQGGFFFLGAMGIVSVVETFSTLRADEKEVLIKLSAFYPIIRLALSSKKSLPKNLGVCLGYSLLFDLVLNPDDDYERLKIGPHAMDKGCHT